MAKSVGWSECDCSICGQRMPILQQWQAVTGQAFIGHRKCAEAKAGEFVMVKKSDLQHVLSRFLEARDALYELLASPDE